MVLNLGELLLNGVLSLFPAFFPINAARMNADSKEAAGGPDIIDQMVAGGLPLGEPELGVGWTLLPVVEPIRLGQECPSYGAAE